ncbi:hypothetical protein GE21DRAFT_7183 [Neurospora crassa]|uniref:Uncharacterized protein n=2 Tax=Neurospora crassa TaxID=5141 RepID=Q1K7R6_NEUCR|nr:hypothetical protein NCU03614 [Neurospora crassa OR74A]EAA32105.1 hypothetical protein NCU03614 [Neurospora crassa OR74A]KHE88821.1 hypothetical protein GE21DRAFT_7183 [Neurospora crassa]CAD11400.1 hypothetical protein [Neurospora crassa]|eukprot:XP_961341.1 hypothetical protein NCU03614 [Neurospora crassa OR74A]
MENASRPHGNRPLWVGFKRMSVVVFGFPELSSSCRSPRLFSLRVAVEPSPVFSSKVALEVGILLITEPNGARLVWARRSPSGCGLLGFIEGSEILRVPRCLGLRCG